mgnify:CR=1 FL=1|jgi:hypothetical protein
MQYITGQHALNLPCSLMTSGDWHQSALQWKAPFFRDSKDSIFGDYGIEHGISIPEHEGVYNVANHIRALLDLLEIGKFTVAQGMNRDYICNDRYTEEIFSQVSKLSNSPLWSQIDCFMGKEYYTAWLEYKKGKQL